MYYLYFVINIAIVNFLLYNMFNFYMFFFYSALVTDVVGL